MTSAKKVVLYGFAIVIALLLTFDMGLALGELVFLIGFLVILMGLFMVVFMKQVKEQERLKEQRKEVRFDVEELIDQNTKVCQYCQTNNSLKANYCKKCKRSLEDIVCPICGHENRYDQKYCQNCGSILQNKKVHL